MTDLNAKVLRRSPGTLPTLSELVTYVRSGRMNKYGAAEYAMARRDAGLCDYCSRKADDEDGICASCRGER